MKVERVENKEIYGFGLAYDTVSKQIRILFWNFIFEISINVGS